MGIIYEGLYEGLVLGALAQVRLALEAVFAIFKLGIMHFYDHRGVDDSPGMSSELNEIVST